MSERGTGDLQPSPQQLANGVRLEGDTLVLEWVPQEVVLLRKYPRLGDWTSTVEVVLDGRAEQLRAPL